ncbi:SpdA protein [Streptomyces sp. NBRC 109706]|uniref:SpdA protein n=1 Tax=Streptomyces sp. NBRC 109706 TaxID=1550035 RepID=UPI001F1FF688|nr:SpdA protein [Streptomyces sp. NBRC 109706]
MIGLTFLFGFGNVLALGLRLGVPAYVAPLVAPAVDLSVLGLLLGVRYLAMNEAPKEQIRPARRLLVLASVMTLALNMAEPVLAGHYGKAAFDAVGPLLLIGWAEVGPGLLQAIAAVGTASGATAQPDQSGPFHTGAESASSPVKSVHQATKTAVVLDKGRSRPVSELRVQPRRTNTPHLEQELLKRARAEDAQHQQEHQRPISAETLRMRLGVGARKSRALVAAVRSETTAV